MIARDDEIEKKIYFHKYKPEKKIGEGSFGKIYSANNIQTNEKYALKMESKDTGQNLLESEAYVLCYLKGYGIPAVRSYGFSGDYNILVMELLYKSLEDLFQDCGGKFSLKTVCMLADQMLERIEYIHNKHIIHRDIKPDNFVMGLGDNAHLVYLIDFGLAKKFRSSRTLQHIKFTNNKKLTGTARYASINALKGCEQSRRDDLEAIGYVLIYFLRGALPWQGLKVDRREDRYKKIYEKKKATTAEELTANYPSEFTSYINYTRNLDFEQEPDYVYLKGLFKKVMEDRGFQFDYLFDWVIKDNIAMKVRTNHDNNQLENRNKANNIRPNINNMNAYNANITDSIAINDLNNQMNVDDKYNNREEKLKMPTNIGVTDSNVLTNLNKQDNNDDRYVSNMQERNRRNLKNNNKNDDRKNTNMANINTHVLNTNNENLNKHNNVNISSLDQNENRKKIKISNLNLDNKQSELLDNTKDSVNSKKKNKSCAIL